MSRFSKPTPVSLPGSLDEKLTEVAEKMDISKQQLMRLAMEIGLEDLKATGYNIASSVVREKERQYRTESSDKKG